MAFILSAQLLGHQADVRSVSSVSTKHGHPIILSASRDQTAIIWTRSASSANEYEQAAVLGGHGGFVNASAFISDEEGNLLALTAGQDKLVNAFEVETDQRGAVKASKTPDFTLIGHEDNVCALDVGPGGSYIVSGSWDKTAKIWKNWDCVTTFKGHSQAVWAVLAVDSERVLTASADKLVRLWSISNPKEPIAVFTGHTDAVRGLVLLEGGQSFASCGNDGTINLYSLADITLKARNAPLQTLSGHTSFVYSLANLPGGKGELVSAGEDRSVRVWRDGSLVQTITIPAISAWTVDVLDNGDIVCGSSDSFVRVFTRDSSRAADPEEIKAYEHTISSQALNQTQVGDINKESLPGKEALSQPGSKEGQTKMVKNGDIVEAYQWSAASGKWEKIGEVVGGVGSGQKKLHEGKEYDYVFDVDIADGVPPLKLPYNLSENPFVAAQRFLEKNDLPMSYIDQVVKFIEKNSQTVSLGATEYVDPYTGSSRYTGTPTGFGSQSAPPPHVPSTVYTGAGNVDPFTRSTIPESFSKVARTSIIPQKAFLSFKTINLQAVRAKIGQLNDHEKANGGPSLSDGEISSLDSLIAALSSSPSSATPLDLSAPIRLLGCWSPSSRFPALDLIRFAVLHNTTVGPTEVARLAFEASQWGEDWPAAGDEAAAKARDTNSMLAMRTLANLWNSAGSIAELERDGVSIIGSLQQSGFERLSKNARVAFATVVYNASAFISSEAKKVIFAGLVLDLVVEILQKETGEAEVIYRTLVALGNLLVSSSSASLKSSKVDSAKEAMLRWTERLKGEERFVSLKRELGSL
ncbi:PFU-domain-containing protein [Violaceomyces palustris]|uniref:PFU-domain-containing protein n=1 Tax=Violaceomyces palustris TaxID=1673888 RepID=A0ACD0NYR6_9BASI|nr:PFU-domain-containing protein [Violaceomyces palustris]